MDHVSKAAAGAGRVGGPVRSVESLGAQQGGGTVAGFLATPTAFSLDTLPQARAPLWPPSKAMTALKALLQALD